MRLRVHRPQRRGSVVPQFSALTENMCSVRSRPIPPAPIRRARRLRGVGVGPDPQPPDLICPGHDAIHGAHQLCHLHADGIGAKYVECSVQALPRNSERPGSATGISPRKTSPVLPSIEMTSPSLTTSPRLWSYAGRRCRRRGNPRRRRQSCPSHARQLPRVTSCLRATSTRRARRPSRQDRQGWSRAEPG